MNERIPQLLNTFLLLVLTVPASLSYGQPSSDVQTIVPDGRGHGQVASPGQGLIGYVVAESDGSLRVVLKDQRGDSQPDFGPNVYPAEKLMSESRTVDGIGQVEVDSSVDSDKAFEGGLQVRSSSTSTEWEWIGNLFRGEEGGIHAVIPMEQLVDQVAGDSQALSGESRGWRIKNTPLDPVTWTGGGGGKPDDSGSRLGGPGGLVEDTPTSFKTSVNPNSGRVVRKAYRDNKLQSTKTIGWAGLLYTTTGRPYYKFRGRTYRSNKPRKSTSSKKINDKRFNESFSTGKYEVPRNSNSSNRKSNNSRSRNNSQGANVAAGILQLLQSANRNQVLSEKEIEESGMFDAIQALSEASRDDIEESERADEPTEIAGSFNQPLGHIERDATGSLMVVMPLSMLPGALETIHGLNASSRYPVDSDDIDDDDSGPVDIPTETANQPLGHIERARYPVDSEDIGDDDDSDTVDIPTETAKQPLGHVERDGVGNLMMVVPLDALQANSRDWLYDMIQEKRREEAAKQEEEERKRSRTQADGHRG